MQEERHTGKVTPLILIALGRWGVTEIHSGLVKRYHAGVIARYCRFKFCVRHKEYCMSEWDNVSWIQKDWVWELGGWILGVALFAAVVWFIDGYRKYGYWRKKDEGEKDA